MAKFVRKNGDIVIIHNHSFSVIEAKHYFDLFVIKSDGTTMDVNKQSRKEGLAWTNFIKSLEET